MRQDLHNFFFGENHRARNSIWHVGSLRAGASLLNSTQTFAEPNQALVWGIDESGRWAGNVDTSATKAAGATFAIFKAIDGTIPTRLWRENRRRALTNGLIVGDYGWLYRDKNVSCKEQARATWELIKDEPKQIPIAIDFEWTNWMGQPSNPDYLDLEKWVSWFTEYSGYKPGFYSAAGYMNQFGPMPDWLRRKFAYFWVANYGVLKPAMPLGFASNDWQFWQFACTGEAMRLAPNDEKKLELDLNYWHGDLASLRTLAGLSGEAPEEPEVEPPPGGGEEPTETEPTPGGSMYRGRTTQLAKVWLNPGSNQIDQIQAGVTVRGNPPNGDYIYLLEPARGYTKRAWVTGYAPEVVVIPEPEPDPDTQPEEPPAEVAPDYIVAHWVASGVTRKYVPE